jgi:hypothetical protein
VLAAVNRDLLSLDRHVSPYQPSTL